MLEQTPKNLAVQHALLGKELPQQNMLIKIKILMLHSHCKSVLTSTNYNLNAWEGYTNDIKQDLAENKSWLKVVCGCRNINTVTWRFVHSLACLTLEQIRRKLNIANNILPVARFKLRNSILLYVSKKLLKRFFAALLPDMECLPGNWFLISLTRSS